MNDEYGPWQGIVAVAAVEEIIDLVKSEPGMYTSLDVVRMLEAL